MPPVRIAGYPADVTLSEDARKAIAKQVGTGRNDTKRKDSIRPFLHALDEELRFYVAMRRSPDLYTYTYPSFKQRLERIEKPLNELLERLQRLSLDNTPVHILLNRVFQERIELHPALLSRYTTAEPVLMYLLCLQDAVRDLCRQAQQEFPHNLSRTPDGWRFGLADKVAEAMRKHTGHEPTSAVNGPYVNILAVVLTEANRHLKRRPRKNASEDGKSNAVKLAKAVIRALKTRSKRLE